jgi:hypothetical protein
VLFDQGGITVESDMTVDRLRDGHADRQALD